MISRKPLLRSFIIDRCLTVFSWTETLILVGKSRQWCIWCKVLRVVNKSCFSYYSQLLSARIGIVQPFTLFWSVVYTLACTARSVSVLHSVLNRPHFISRQQSI